MFKNILTTFSTKFLISIMNFILVVITSRFLGAEIRGEISLVVLALAIITLISEIIGGPATVYLIPKTNIKPLLIPSYVWGVFASLIATAVLSMLGYLPQGYEVDIFLLGLMATFKVSNNTLIFGKKKILEVNLVHLLYFVSLFLSVLYFIFIDHQTTLKLYINGLFISSLLALFLSSFFLIRNNEGDSYFLKKDNFLILIRNGIFNQLSNVFHVLTNRINFYLLGVTALIGVYSAGISFTEALLLFSGSSAGILMAEVANEKSATRSQRLALGLAKVNLIICLFGLVLLMLLPQSFYILLLGNEFEDVKLVLTFLGPGICFISYKAQLTHYFSGKGKHYINTIAALGSLLVNIVFAIFLIPQFGLKGAAISASIAYFVSLSIAVGFFKKERIIATSFLFPQKEELNLVRKKISEKFGLS